MASEIVFSRNKHIDVMRGIGIILVVLGHTYRNSGMLYLFHMPLFFMLSHCCPVKILKYHLSSNSRNSVLDIQALI